MDYLVGALFCSRSSQETKHLPCMSNCSRTNTHVRSSLPKPSWYLVALPSPASRHSDAPDGHSLLPKLHLCYPITLILQQNFRQDRILLQFAHAPALTNTGPIYLFVTMPKSLISNLRRRKGPPHNQHEDQSKNSPKGSTSRLVHLLQYIRAGASK